MNILERADELKKKMNAWNEKILSVPFISFDPEWEVRVVPSFFMGLGVFKIRHKKNPEKIVSITLDPNTLIIDEPTFWEINLGGMEKSQDENIICIPINKTEDLLKKLREILS